MLLRHDDPFNLIEDYEKRSLQLGYNKTKKTKIFNDKNVVNLVYL